MATVRQSITALYEQSQKSASEGRAMFAVIESEAVTSFGGGDDASDDMDFEIPAADAPPPIARRFEDLRDLAEHEVDEDAMRGHALFGTAGHGDAAPHDISPPSSDITVSTDHITVTSSGGDFDTGPEDETALPAGDPPETSDKPEVEADIIEANSRAAAPDLALPSEPPAPAAGDSLSDLDVADIQELVRQAWEDETALGTSEAGTGPETAPKATGQNDNAAGSDHDIELAMEEIAAAVVQSGDMAAPVDLAAMKAELVAAMRAELQAVMAVDLRPMIKAAIAEAMRDLPAAQPKTRAKKAASGKAAPKKATTRARKTATKKGAARKKADN